MQQVTLSRRGAYDINHNVQPMLAESWDVSSDFTSIKFNLHKFWTSIETRDKYTVIFKSDKPEAWLA